MVSSRGRSCGPIVGSSHSNAIRDALPARLLDVDRLLDDDRVTAPMVKRIQQRIGRPTIPMECYLRMMYLKHDRGLGYETLVQ